MVKWIGTKPTHCDVCHRELRKEFIDGKTTMGPWAIMCSRCHKSHGVGLGTGRGQKYSLETQEKING